MCCGKSKKKKKYIIDGSKFNVQIFLNNNIQRQPYTKRKSKFYFKITNKSKIILSVLDHEHR